jgi:hypothetical protein
MKAITIKISTIPESFTQLENEALISFLGRVLFAAYKASSPQGNFLTASLNGKSYTFKNKLVSVISESLPKFERLSFAANNEILKPNFVGFVLNALFASTKDFKGLQIHKNKDVNDATNKATSLQSMTKILLAEYEERKARQSRDIAAGQKLALSYGIGKNTASYKAETKEIKAEIYAILLPPSSEAKAKNTATRNKRNKVKVATIAAPTTEVEAVS